MEHNVSVHFDGACRLHAWSVMRAEGPEAGRFLHSQFTQAFDPLPAGQARLAAYCNAQGRMLASVIGCRADDHAFWLAGSADLMAATVKRLGLFVLRAKLKLHDAGDGLAVFGAAGPTAVAGLGGERAAPWSAYAHRDLRLIHLPAAEGLPRLLGIGPRDAVAAALSELAVLPVSTWDWLEVRSGVARIVAATSAQFVPQMLNFEVIGGVDFKKGCYPGQEIVARSQYLGKLKRRAHLLQGDVPMQAGQEVFWSGDEGQPAGMVALAAAHPQHGHEALVELKSAVLAQGSLHLGAPGGPLLQVLPLPYPLPADAASAA